MPKDAYRTTDYVLGANFYSEMERVPVGSLAWWRWLEQAVRR